MTKNWWIKTIDAKRMIKILIRDNLISKRKLCLIIAAFFQHSHPAHPFYRYNDSKRQELVEEWIERSEWHEYVPVVDQANLAITRLTIGNSFHLGRRNQAEIIRHVIRNPFKTK